MLGQELTVHIVTCSFLRLQRVWKYKYEVVAESSPFKGDVEMAYSPFALRDGHYYVVRFQQQHRESKDSGVP
jgi:hypothetical protein